MKLYDEDTKLITADTQQIKIWEFIHNKDDAPEMSAYLQVPLKVEQAFVNRAGDNFYTIITCKDLFEVYTCKLDRVFSGQIPGGESIKNVEFDRTGTCFYVGTEKGKIFKYSI